MRLISLIPSITETLIECDLELVGRSRFCIHPQSKLETIPRVGGTKDVDWQKAAALKPDLVILDKEENTLEMAENCPFPVFALHIESVNDVGSELKRLADHIDSDKLKHISQRWQKLDHLASTNKQIPAPKQKTGQTIENEIEDIPGMVEWWRKPTSQTNFEYLIWRDPWMAIGENTFIQSMLDLLIPNKKIRHSEKYPVVDIEQLSPDKTCLLFSSEPYPFARYKEQLLALGFSCGLIDGEKYSWYGIRSLQFLENLIDNLIETKV